MRTNVLWFLRVWHDLHVRVRVVGGFRGGARLVTTLKFYMMQTPMHGDV